MVDRFAPGMPLATLSVGLTLQRPSGWTIGRAESVIRRSHAVHAAAHFEEPHPLCVFCKFMDGAMRVSK